MGWSAAAAAEFIGLSAEESRYVNLKLALATGVRELRERRGIKRKFRVRARG